jgi:hypothetical protein
MPPQGKPARVSSLVAPLVSRFRLDWKQRLRLEQVSFFHLLQIASLSAGASRYPAGNVKTTIGKRRRFSAS